jgi:dienelactone hydrolase
VSEATSRTSGKRVSAPHRYRTKRMREQRWLVDDIIRANGIDWDQPRSFYLAAPCGPEANADFAQARAQVQKLADATMVFEALARKREARAAAAEAKAARITARDNYFIAAIHWGAAQWPIERDNEQNQFYNTRKRDCYRAYAGLADHHVEEVWIPFEGKSMPAWFHLPPGYNGGPLPTVVSVPGMDSFKEVSVSLYGDPWLQRGFAVLAIDGPGQYEAPLVGLHMSMDAWSKTGRICMDWLLSRPEVDADRVGITGISFGSFAATIAAAGEPRFRACAVTAVCHEPGFHTIFEEASPTFKERFMFMCDIEDEEAFEAMKTSMSWVGHAEKIRMPYLCIAGEFDELSPFQNTDDLVSHLAGPKQMIVYQGLRHALVGAASSNGPFPWTYVADWMDDRMRDVPLASERWFVESSGRVVSQPL